MSKTKFYEYKGRKFPITKLGCENFVTVVWETRRHGKIKDLISISRLDEYFEKSLAQGWKAAT